MSLGLKEYAVIVLLIILGFLYYQHMGLQEDLAKSEASNSLLKEATNLLRDEINRKSQINATRETERDTARAAKRKLQDELRKIKTTPQQEKCDATPLPAGYADSLLNGSD